MTSIKIEKNKKIQKTLNLYNYIIICYLLNRALNELDISWEDIEELDASGEDNILFVLVLIELSEAFLLRYVAEIE